MTHPQCNRNKRCIDCGGPVSTKRTLRCHLCARIAPKNPRRLRGFTPNAYRIEGSTAFLALTDRDGITLAETMVDIADLGIALRFHWSLNTTGYASCATERQGVHTNLALHRVIMGCHVGDGVIVDHINRDKLDNRRQNLRRTDSVVNAGNRSRKVSSRFPGVTWCKRTSRWLAQGRKNGRGYFLGRHDHEEEAAQAYLAWRERENLPPLADPDGLLRNVRQWSPKVRPVSPQSSRHNGVVYCKQTGRWRAQPHHNGKLVWLGRHDTEEGAAAAIRQWRQDHGLTTSPEGHELDE